MYYYILYISIYSTVYRTIAGSQVEFFYITEQFPTVGSCHKELYLRSYGTPGSASVQYSYPLCETSITSFCSDNVISLSIIYLCVCLIYIYWLL